MPQLAILYFAWVREAIGSDEERVEHPGTDVTIAALIDILAQRSEGHARAFADRARLRAALDQRFVPLDTSTGVK